MSKVSEKLALVTELRALHGDKVTRKEVLAFTTSKGLEKPRWLFNDKAFRTARGSYDLSKVAVEGSADTNVGSPEVSQTSVY